MVEIRPLEVFDAGILRTLSPGYVSYQRYAVKKRETADHTSISLDLVDLPEPYVKQWEWGEDYEDWYPAVVGKDASYLACEGDSVVGMAISDPQRWNRVLNVCEIHVAEEARGRGIGRLLVQKLVVVAHEQGLRALVCETQNTNVPAIRFYRAVGFELDAIDLSYYTNTDADEFEVALFMKKKLPAATSG